MHSHSDRVFTTRPSANTSLHLYQPNGPKDGQIVELIRDGAGDEAGHDVRVFELTSDQCFRLGRALLGEVPDSPAVRSAAALESIDKALAFIVRTAREEQRERRP